MAINWAEVAALIHCRLERVLFPAALVRRGLEELFGDIVGFEQRPLRPGSKTGSAVAVFAELASARAAVATRLVSLEGLLGAGTEATVRRVEILPFRSLGSGGGQGGAVGLLAGSVKLEARVDSLVAMAYARQLADSAAARSWHSLVAHPPGGGFAAARGQRAVHGGGPGACCGSGGGAVGDDDVGDGDSDGDAEGGAGMGASAAGGEGVQMRIEESAGHRALPGAGADGHRRLCELAVGSVAQCVLEEQTATTSEGAAPAAPLQSAAPSLRAVAELRPVDRPLLCPGAAGPPSPDVVRLLSFAGTGRVWRVRDMQLVFPERARRPTTGTDSRDGNDSEAGPQWWCGGGW